LTPDTQASAQKVASPQRIKELTLKKVGRSASPVKSRRVGRVLVPVLVCVIAVFAITSTAFTTDAFGIRSNLHTNLRQFFGSGDAELSSGTLDEIIQAGKGDVPPAVEENGTTVTPISAIAGKDYYYLALKIDAHEGVSLDRGDSYYQVWGNTEENAPTLTYADGEALHISWNMATSYEDDVVGDNSLIVVIEITGGPGFPSGDDERSTSFAFNDGVPKILTLHGLWLQSPTKQYTQLIEGTWVFDIGSYFTDRGDEAADPTLPPIPTGE